MFLLDYQYKRPNVLLGTQNAKTIKGEKLNWKTHILYMSPSKFNTFGFNMCSHSTEGCRKSCLFTAGRGQMNKVQMARLHKTEYFLREKDTFMNHIVKEVKTAINNKNGMNICIRLNGTSDIMFEDIPIGGFDNIMSMFKNVQFYDYTKNHERFNKVLPSNYHLTLSYSGKNEKECLEVLNKGYNVAIVFGVKYSSDLPKEYMGYPVINGDQHDLTFLHGSGNIIGLRAKGKGMKDTSGFVVRNF